MEPYEKTNIYVKLLCRSSLQLRGNDICSIGAALGFKFSPSTLVKTSKENSPRYHIRKHKRAEIADLLYLIMRAAIEVDPFLLENLKKRNIDINDEKPITKTFSDVLPGQIRDLLKIYPQTSTPPDPLQNFLSRELSHMLECEAKSVDIITRDLSWVMSHIKEISKDLKSKPEKMVRCLVTCIGPGYANIQMVNWHLKGQGVPREQLQIIKLPEVMRMEEVGSGEVFPMFGDIRIYHDTRYPGADVRMTVGVASFDTVIVRPRYTGYYEERGWRLHDYQWKKIDHWFCDMWNKYYKKDRGVE